MKKHPYLLSFLLTAVVFAVMLIMMLIRVWNPAGVLPRLDIPNMALISLVVLILEHYLSPKAPRNYVAIALLSFLTFALLPLMAGFACVHDFWKIGLVGSIVFTALTFLYTSMVSRISSGEKAVAAPIVSALGLYLAIQGFAGIFL